MAADGLTTSREDQTTQLVRRLVRSILAKHGPSSANDGAPRSAVPEKTIERLFRYSLRLVGSCLSASVEPDEGAAADAIKRRLSRGATSGPSHVLGLRFAELHRQLSQQPGLRSRWALLHAMLQIAEDRAAEGRDARRGAGAAAAAAALLAHPLSSSARSGGLPAMRDNDEPRGGNLRGRAHGEASNGNGNGTHAGSLAAGDGSTLGLDHPGARAVAYRELAAEAVANLEVGEAELVRDVLFACQGIDGKHIRYSPSVAAYAVAPDAPVTPGARHLARKLTELGWLFRRIRGALGGSDGGSNRGARGAEGPSTPSLGVVGGGGYGWSGGEGGSTRQAFRAAVQAELADYYRLIAVLEAQAQVPMASALEATTNSEGGGGGPEKGGHGGTYLTLRRLSVWLAEPLRRLRLLAVLVDAGEHARGGALLTELHAHTRHGDPAACATVTRLLSAAAAPILQMVQQWVVAGELDDPRGEFFVVSDPAVPEEDLWRHRYRLDDGMLPPFISAQTAADVLRVGKSINFLRRCCDDDSWAEEQAFVAAAAAAAGGLGYDNPAALDALVGEAKRRIDRCLRRVLFERYKFGEHCFAVKRYLLLGQGDFHHYLMDLIGPDLDEPASSVSAYRLTGTLEAAIRASNAQFDSADVLDRLRVRMMAHVGGEEQGWDVFSLEYTVTPPLTTVFTEAAMGKYLRVFNFLWRLKRVEHSLCATWQTMKPNVTAALQRDGVAGSAGQALAGELRRCHTLRGEMHHFIANLQYYVMFEVLEGSWEVFRREMDEAKDLDSLITAHDRYLDTILQKGLLGPKSQLLTHTLGTLFEVILRFRGYADRLYEVARDAAMRRQLAQLRVEQRAEESRWGSLPGEDAAGGDGLLSDEFVEEMRMQLDAVSVDYAKILDGFLNLLPLQTHVDLKFLLFRLDFSEYYSDQRFGPSASAKTSF